MSGSENGVQRYFAHTAVGRDWEPLDEHLRKVAELAAQFAEPFGAAEWARLAGLWHDLGKYSGAFQAYLRDASLADPHIGDVKARTDHSTAGAQHAVDVVPVLGHLLAFIISGHHSGLLDARSGGPCLEGRLGKVVENWKDSAPRALLEPGQLELPLFLQAALQRNDGAAFSFAFFTRLLFSCLVDADFLATEAFVDGSRSEQRPAWGETVIAEMESALDGFIAAMKQPSTPVQRERALVREYCLLAAELPTGLFSLTVPTGGGKTLSSLAFGLRHAGKHGLRRVIYVAPFTTIIEQNADVFRSALDSGRWPADPVLEHHSDLDVGEETATSRLATENWDAPLIVTTAVQFYESLFANRTSRCRKLHRLAKSVIVLDEAQALPIDFLEPCLEALRELALHYGSTVVLCTATQPAIRRRPSFAIGLEGVREIVPDTSRLFSALKRVEVVDLGTVSDAQLGAQLLAEEAVLCVVNTRAHARMLFEALGECEAHFHLSALMCPEHRKDTLSTIRARLDQGAPCRVVSTQLIEAGVDIDFPVVYRALAGLDSIAQAAGRCNRSGSRPSLGRTVVFQSEHRLSERYFAETADCASQVLPLHEDPLSLEAIEHFFRLYYWEQQERWDARGILHEFHLNRGERNLPFLFGYSRVAERFRLIEDAGKPVVIPRRERGRQLCAELRDPWRLPSRELIRKLGRFTVNIPARLWSQHLGSALELVGERFAVLVSPEMHYSERTGLHLDGGEGAPLIL